jgi:tetratricopeptide (TPR) repeat protein
MVPAERRRTTVRNTLLAAVLASMVCSAALAQVTADEIKKASRFYQKGARALQVGNIPQATENFDKALERAPGFPEALIGRGHIAMSEQRYGDALAAYQAARDGYAEFGAVLLDLRSKRYAESQKQIQALQDQLTQLQFNTNSQQANLQAAQLENAISQLQAIAAPTQGDATEPPGEVFFYIGNAMFRLNRFGEALEAWEACRERTPEYAMVYNNLALAYWKEGRMEEAVASLDRAEELGFPVNPQFRQDLEAAAR